MINYIKQMIGIRDHNIFSHKENKQEEIKQEEVQLPTLLCGVKFNLYKDGNVDVKCEWNKNYVGDNYADIFGEFLYHVGMGNMESNIISILERLYQDNIGLRPFVAKTVKKIEYLKGLKDDTPVISPLSVFNMTKPPQES